MANISYAPVTAAKVKVLLEKKIVGLIKAKGNGFAYFPKANPKMHGEVFATINDVKKSLESE